METTGKRCIGLLMAKGKSRRLPGKNISNLGNRPLLSYPLESMIISGICDKIIVSTDSEEVAEIALKYGADDVVMREKKWDAYPTYEPCLEGSLRKYQMKSGEQFDECAVMSGNCIFIRPSWLRVALYITRNTLYHDLPVQACECQSFVCMSVFRITHGGFANYNSFLLEHKGIICDMDDPEDLILANQVLAAINADIIHYPLEESIHEDVYRDRDHSHFNGLKTISGEVERQYSMVNKREEKLNNRLVDRQGYMLNCGA